MATLWQLWHGSSETCVLDSSSDCYLWRQIRSIGCGETIYGRALIGRIGLWRKLKANNCWEQLLECPEIDEITKVLIICGCLCISLKFSYLAQMTALWLIIKPITTSSCLSVLLWGRLAQDWWNQDYFCSYITWHSYTLSVLVYDHCSLLSMDISCSSRKIGGVSSPIIVDVNASYPTLKLAAAVGYIFLHT